MVYCITRDKKKTITTKASLAVLMNWPKVVLFWQGYNVGLIIRLQINIAKLHKQTKNQDDIIIKL